MEQNASRLEQLHQKLASSIDQKEGFARHNGIRISEVGLHRCVGELPLGPSSRNALGIVHGGALFSLADTVAGVAACSGGVSAVTLNSSFDFLRTPKGEVVHCVAEALKVGRQTMVFRCRLTDETGELVAAGQFTFLVLGPLRGFENQERL